jgi:hypothetical protein
VKKMPKMLHDKRRSKREESCMDLFPCGFLVHKAVKEKQEIGD